MKVKRHGYKCIANVVSTQINFEISQINKVGLIPSETTLPHEIRCRNENYFVSVNAR